MMQRIKCFFGLHNWIYGRDVSGFFKEIAAYRKCYDCNKAMHNRYDIHTRTSKWYDGWYGKQINP